jgi:hypothetical protein
VKNTHSVCSDKEARMIMMTMTMIACLLARSVSSEDDGGMNVVDSKKRKCDECKTTRPRRPTWKTRERPLPRPFVVVQWRPVGRSHKILLVNVRRAVRTVVVVHDEMGRFWICFMMGTTYSPKFRVVLDPSRTVSKP